ncbi:hypothetical protein J7E99_39910 [Streptomyces sp. ISL-44]|uniref:hypothetical protein n=1 Tax=Streptomyces sp. ISL-44 TaxID=2819184 RepID=UPI001BE7FCD7|nr:hypothetical protein [Streptomyces sp. ISL-44]MBT2546651.1 hypothetical protein [Streptomyces sp. ISL-44]
MDRAAAAESRLAPAGVWLYHDHSIWDMGNVGLGAIGIIVIHNPADDRNEVDVRLPGDPTSADPALLPDRVEHVT